MTSELPLRTMLARRSPLHGRCDAPVRGIGSETTAPVRIHERPFLAKIDLKLAPNDTTARAAVAASVGFGLPLKPNTATEGSDIAALWFGPDHWLLVSTRPERDMTCEAALVTALAAHHVSIVDVSDQQTVVVVTGERSRYLLGKGCAIDLLPTAFAPGQCVRTVFAHVAVAIHCLAENEFNIYVEQSSAAWFVDWLYDASREYR